MNDAYTEIFATYDKDTMEEIASHGCASGVCFKHIYYGDTIKFYDKYEEEITEYFRDNYGTEFLVELFQQADGWLTQYKNSVTWAYIESIAFNLVDGEVYCNESLLQPA